jgi:hypothetical protein
VSAIFRDLDAWLEDIDVGSTLREVSAEAAAIEVAVALRFRFRDARSRRAYLGGLADEGRIPLAGTDSELSSAASLMRALGATEEEVFRCIGHGSAADSNGGSG